MVSILRLNGSVGRGRANDPDDVYAMDRSLQDINAYDVPPEYANEPQSYMTEPAINAIESVQERNGLKIDGIANPGGPTERAINNTLLGKPRGAGLLFEPIPRISDTVGNSFKNALADVRAVKRGLGALGLTPEDPFDNPNGYITKEATDGLKNFQLAQGLTPDGWMAPGGETETAMRRSLDDLAEAKGAEWLNFVQRAEAFNEDRYRAINKDDDSDGSEQGEQSPLDKEPAAIPVKMPDPGPFPWRRWRMTEGGMGGAGNSGGLYSGAEIRGAIGRWFASFPRKGYSLSRAIYPFSAILGALESSSEHTTTSPKATADRTEEPAKVDNAKKAPPPASPGGVSDADRESRRTPQLGAERRPGTPPRDGLQGVRDPDGYQDVSSTLGSLALRVVTADRKGRLGDNPTREQIDDILDDILREAKRRDCEVIHLGGGMVKGTGKNGRGKKDGKKGTREPEVYLQPRNQPEEYKGTIKGGSFADLAIEGPKGARLFINTYDVLRSRFAPTAREQRGAARLLENANLGDFLFMVPKVGPDQQIDPKALKTILRLMLDKICRPGATTDDRYPADLPPYYPPNDPRKNRYWNK